MNLPFEPFDQLPQLQQSVVDAFCKLARETVEQNGVFRVSLSGGSTPKRVYEMLAERDLPWQKIHWFWGDERNVPTDHADSNFRMVHTALLGPIKAPEPNVHAVPVNVDQPAAAAEQYEATLRDHFEGRWPKFDLVFLGMGDDAHTASLFPETAALENSDRWFVENWVPKFDAYRYTMTYNAIAAGENIWFIVTGGAKRQAMQQVLFGDPHPALYPSQRIRPTRWFVDSQACPSA